jgi:acyl-CoA reductase-like NAD-dependent aldehyde dehydrogenase
VAPTKGEYSANRTPTTGEVFTEVSGSTPEDVELALDAAHAAKTAWGEASTTERSRVPASPAPWSILKLAELLEAIVPAGILNIVNGPGAEIGKALATNKRIAKIAFTGETGTGRLIMEYAAQNIIPWATELGGKSPNIFFADVMASDDDFLDKAVEGLVLYAFNKGEV